MTIFDEFEQKGFEKGIQIGILKGISLVNNVIRLWQKGIEIPKIAKSTDLPIEQVKNMIAHFESEN